MLWSQTGSFATRSNHQPGSFVPFAQAKSRPSRRYTNTSVITSRMSKRRPRTTLQSAPTTGGDKRLRQPEEGVMRELLLQTAQFSLSSAATLRRHAALLQQASVHAALSLGFSRYESIPGRSMASSHSLVFQRRDSAMRSASAFRLATYS